MQHICLMQTLLDHAVYLGELICTGYQLVFQISRTWHDRLKFLMAAIFRVDLFLGSSLGPPGTVLM